MSKFILLECNRDRAIDTTFDSGKKDIFKNKWTNQVSNSGIVVNAGDVLNIDETIVNSIGANIDVMEFTGKNNENNIVDNKIALEVSYYINHTGKNSGNMPLVGHKTFRGTGDLRVLAFNDGDFSNAYSENGQLLAYTEHRYQHMIADRSLGEPFFGTLATDTMQYDNTEFYDNQKLMANTQKVFGMKLLTRGGGLANQPNTGFKEGQLITVTTDDITATGTTMEVRIESTITIGTIPNVIESFSITQLGDKVFNGTAPTGVSRITFPVGGASMGTDQVYEVTRVLSGNYESSDIREFDGERYFPLQVGFTGLAFFNDSQVNNGEPNDPITASFDIDKIQSQPTLRTNEVVLNVPSGFSTPSNVANILTQQMGKPEKLNENFNNGKFLDVETFNYFHDVNGQFIQDGKPNIIASQMFQPQSCNWLNNGKSNKIGSSFVGRRQQFYSSIAWKEPDRWTGLVPAFKQFAVNASPFDENNDIAIARGTRAAELNDYGDFSRQGTGEFGCHVSVIHSPTVFGTHNHNTLSRGELIITNIRYTQRNLNRLRLMKECEKYMGDLSEKVDTDSDNFREFLSVNLDIGMYDDEMSTQGKYTQAEGGSPRTFTGQKRKFATIDEAISSGFCVIDTDEGHLNGLYGFQRDLENINNQGQELSNLWVKSRWSEKYRFKNSIDSDGDVIDLGNDIRYSTTFNSLGNDTKFNTTNTDMRQVFGNGYMTDEGFISIDDMNNMARDLDLAVISVNVPINYANPLQNSEWYEIELTGKNQLPPFLAFIVGANYGDPATTVFDTVKQFSGTGSHWVSDASNFKYGSMLGFDPSFSRNKAVCMLNNQFNGGLTLEKNNFLNYLNLGAVNPQIRFDTDFSRFGLSGLNTPTFIGNGLTTDDPLEFTPNDNPEQQVIVVGRTNQVLPSRQKNIGTNPTGYDPGTGAGFPPKLLNVSQFKDAKQKEATIMDSQTGVCLEHLILFDEEDNQTIITSKDYFSDNHYKYHNCLLDKMGFDFTTLFPSFGDRNAFFRDSSLFNNKDATYTDSIQNVTKPLTTGAKLTTEITQTFSVNQENAPLFDLGGDILIDPITVDAIQGEITGNKLPSKFDFSYLTINSSLVSEGTDTIYIGGSDNQSKLPCMTYLTRENNESDFFYQSEKGFSFTATKDFTITDITTDIRLPNGDRPFLDSHSTVIYKIEKPIRSLPLDTQPIPTHTKPHSRKEEEDRSKRNKERK